MPAHFTFGFRTGWKTATISAAAMWVLTYLVVEQGLGPPVRRSSVQIVELTRRLAVTSSARSD
jgi:hypothetical protein